jgi:hypothetical protein
MPQYIKEFALNSWSVLGQMSPYLLLGFLISGILSVFISPKWVEKHLGAGRFGSIVKATLFGIPLPLCSCGVIPVSASLRQHGASKAATTSFLLSTPQTGVDSIMATWGLLGGVFAIFRPLSALVTGIIGGVLVWLFDEDFSKAESGSNSLNGDEPIPEGFTDKIKSALNYGFISLPGEIAKPLFVGILVAGLISTFVAGNILNQYLTSHYLTMLIMLAIGIPLYVCSTSSIPIALSFIHMGVTPGAALVFLISGPATNAATISVIYKILGKKSAFLYLFTVFTGSLASGIAFDYLDQSFSLGVMDHLKHGMSHGGGWLEHISAIAILLILAYSYYKAQVSNHCDTCCASNSSEDLQSIHTFVLKVDGMSCNNCVKAVTRTLKEVEGVK